jgi:tRNA pseudouridine38-40 synthase
MVRILAGTLLEVGTGEIKADDIPDIIAGLDRDKAGVTLPSSGLMLYEVEY